MKAKYIVIPVLFLSAGFLYYTSKINQWKLQLPKLITFPTALKNATIKGGSINATIDIAIKNPTNNAFKPDGLIAILKRVNVYTPSNKLIATVQVNKSSLTVPANGTTTIKNLVIQVPIFQNLININEFKNIIKNKTFKDIRTESVISVLGKEYIV